MSDAVLERARGYVRKGYSPIPVPHREKNPGFKPWQAMRLQEADLPQHFNGRPMNVGVLLGAPSGDLVDIDLDAAEAVTLADQFLPKTGSEFGRASKPRSHRLFVTKIKTEKFSDLGTNEDDETAMVVEIRATGGRPSFRPRRIPRARRSSGCTTAPRRPSRPASSVAPSCPSRAL